MNGANLHETGVRQMGRAEGGGRGDEEREAGRQGGREGEEWLLKRRERGKQTQG